MGFQTDYAGMTVKEYVQVNGRGSVSKLARLTGSHWRTIKDLATEKSTPSARMAVALEYATDGAIPAEKSLQLGLLRKEAEVRLSRLKEMEGFRLGGKK